MPRYIDAEKFDVVSSAVPDGMDPDSYCAGMEFMLQKIETAPTEKVISIVYSAPQRIFSDPFSGRIFTTCENCLQKISAKDHYCRHCGAKLVTGEKSQHYKE